MPLTSFRPSARRLDSSSQVQRVEEDSVADDGRKALIDGLNEDLRGEFQAVIMYRLYASMVQGPYRQELRTFFAKELGHAQILADKVAALGGTPASTAADVPVVSEPKAMLQAALKAEIDTIGRYVQRRKQAEEAGEHGLAAEFDQIIADETNHRDELQQMLARWP
jgi:bacterioferritin